MSFIGVISAFNLEAKVLNAKNTKIKVLVSGPGLKAASEASQELLQQGAEGLLSWGVAGSLDSKIKPGSIILPRAVVMANQQKLFVTSLWQLKIMQQLVSKLPVVTGSLLTVAKIVSLASDKLRLSYLHDAVAVDMESYAVGQAASQAGVPFLVIRAISDSADQDLPKLVNSSLIATGRVDLAKLLTHIIKYPLELPAIFKLGWQFSRAINQLKRVI